MRHLEAKETMIYHKTCINHPNSKLINLKPKLEPSLLDLIRNKKAHHTTFLISYQILLQLHTIFKMEQSSTSYKKARYLKAFETNYTDYFITQITDKIDVRNNARHQ
jgi:hypothetical protein